MQIALACLQNPALPNSRPPKVNFPKLFIALHCRHLENSSVSLKMRRHRDRQTFQLLDYDRPYGAQKSLRLICAARANKSETLLFLKLMTNTFV